MKPLDPIPQCVDCLKSMARDVIQLIDPSDPMVLEEVERISNDIIEDAKGSKPNSPQIANRILKKIRELTQVDDPYADFKSREMDQARKLFSQIKNEIPKGAINCRDLVLSLLIKKLNKGGIYLKPINNKIFKHTPIHNIFRRRRFQST